MIAGKTGIAVMLILGALLVASCGAGDPNPAPGPSPQPQPQPTPVTGPSNPSPPGSPGSPTNPTSPTNPGPGSTSSNSKLAAHIAPGCTANLYQVNIGTIESTCQSLWTVPDDVIQVTLSDSTGTPPAAGRSYVVKPQSAVDTYPADGEATAVFSGKNGAMPINDGTFTIAPSTGGPLHSGTYKLVLSSGQTLSGSFSADTCDAGSCE